MKILQRNDNPKVQNLYNKIVEHIVSNIPANLSNEKKVEAIYYYMIKHTKYDYEALNLISEDGLVYGSWIEEELVEGSTASKYVVGIAHVGLCAGIAPFFKDLCDAMNINCYLVEGKTKVVNEENGTKLGHVWNMVAIESNKNLYVDVTYGIFARDKKENPMDFCLIDGIELQNRGPHSEFASKIKTK